MAQMCQLCAGGSADVGTDEAAAAGDVSMTAVLEIAWTASDVDMVSTEPETVVSRATGG